MSGDGILQVSLLRSGQVILRCGRAYCLHLQSDKFLFTLKMEAV